MREIAQLRTRVDDHEDGEPQGRNNAAILLRIKEAELEEVCGQEHEQHQPVIAKLN